MHTFWIDLCNSTCYANKSYSYIQRIQNVPIDDINKTIWARMEDLIKLDEDE
jgi:hypothetical protein